MEFNNYSALYMVIFLSFPILDLPNIYTTLLDIITLVSSASVAFIISCEYQIYQGLFSHYAARKFQMSLSNLYVSQHG